MVCLSLLSVAPVSSLKGLDVLIYAYPALPCRAVTFRPFGAGCEEIRTSRISDRNSSPRHSGLTPFSAFCKTAWLQPAPSRLDREFQLAPLTLAPRVPTEHRPAQCSSSETERTIR